MYKESFDENLAILADANSSWEKTISSLRVLCQYCGSKTNHAIFYQYRQDITKIFGRLLKNLRSQVIKEVCLTYTYLAVQLGQDYDKFASVCASESGNMLIAYPKVVKSAVEISMSICCKFIHSATLLEVIMKNFDSRSQKVRKCYLQCLKSCLASYGTEILSKFTTKIFDTVKLGLTDKDEDVRREAKEYFYLILCNC